MIQKIGERHTSKDAKYYHEETIRMLEDEEYILDDTKSKVEKVSDNIIAMGSDIDKVAQDFFTILYGYKNS